MDIPSNSTTDQKLDIIIAAMGTLIKGQEAISSLINKVNKLESTVAEHETTITSLSKEVRSLKEAANERDNEARGSNIRIFNFPMAEDETNVEGKVFDRIIKPVLAAAKSNGEISSVPNCSAVISSTLRTVWAGTLRLVATNHRPPSW